MDRLGLLVRQARARPLLAAAAAALGLLLPPALAALARSYRGYLALGPGGIPHSWRGWLLQAVAQPWALRDPLATASLERPAAAVLERYGGRARAHRSYLDIDAALPARRGPRPVVPRYVAPQRQTSDLGPDPAAVRARQEAFLRALVDANPGVLSLRPSALEGNHTPALWARAATPLGAACWDADARQRGRGAPEPVELAHAHAGASAHMQFSLADACWVLRAGWGERHLLAGSSVARVPPSFLLVYAPRDDAELRLWKQLVLAAARFAVGDDVELDERAASEP